MKHLVLGSEGQVGSYVVKELESQREEVVRWDIKLNPLHDLTVPYRGLYDAVMDSDFVHYLASVVGGSKFLSSNQDDFNFINDNVLIMENVFGTLKVAKKPFYFTSSQMVHTPGSTYGKLKSVGEAYARSLNGFVVRFWNVYGYENEDEKAHVITDFIRMAVEDGCIQCKTTGEERRNFMHGSDVAFNLCQIPDFVYHPDPIEILSDELWYSVREVAQAVAGIIGGLTGNPVRIQLSEKLDSVQGPPTYKDPFNHWYRRVGGRVYMNLFEGITSVYHEMYP